MKVHIKALLISIGVLLILIGAFYIFNMGNSRGVPESKIKVSLFELPKVDLIDLSGRPFNLKSFAGKVIIFNFWASWCAPCIEEVPSLVSLVKEDPNIVIIAVSGDQNKEDIHAFLKSFPGFNKPPIYVVHENMKAIVDYFKVDKLPESFIFNPKGEMVRKITGTINWHTPESIEYFKYIRAQ